MNGWLSFEDKCPHCESHFIWSDLLERTADLLTLECSLCDNTYRLPNTPAQREALSRHFGRPTETKPLTDVRQLRQGDHITFYRTAWIINYQHHAIVTKVVHESGEVRVAEFTKDLPLRRGSVIRQTKNFDSDIKPKTPYVLRYMPLDCQPLSDVLANASAFVDNPSSQPSYVLFWCNCHHLCAYCKTGRM